VATLASCHQSFRTADESLQKSLIAAHLRFVLGSSVAASLLFDMRTNGPSYRRNRSSSHQRIDGSVRLTVRCAHHADGRRPEQLSGIVSRHDAWSAPTDGSAAGDVREL
jgi:hypothetical protein